MASIVVIGTARINPMLLISILKISVENISWFIVTAIDVVLFE